MGAVANPACAGAVPKASSPFVGQHMRDLRRPGPSPIRGLEYRVFLQDRAGRVDTSEGDRVSDMWSTRSRYASWPWNLRFPNSALILTEIRTHRSVPIFPTVVQFEHSIMLSEPTSKFGMTHQVHWLWRQCHWYRHGPECCSEELLKAKRRLAPEKIPT